MAPRINLPPGTRVLLLANILLSALNATLRLTRWRDSLATLTPTQLATTPSNYLSSPQWAIPFLAIVPVYSIRYPWTFLTAALVENNVLSLAISATVLWFGGRYLERAWGSREFGKFVGFVAVIPNVLAFAIYAAWHVVVGTPEFPTPIQGVIPLEAAFLVALKQLVPEHTVSLFRGAVRVRIKHFPALFTLANIVSGPLLGTDTALWLSLFGFLTGWVYLRFFRITDTLTGAETSVSGEASTMRGDASDTFAFVAFFPDIMHPILAPVCDGIYNTLVALRLFPAFSNDAVEAGNESAARSEGLPSIMERGAGGRQVEAERRRAIALKALDQRLSLAAASRVVDASIQSTSSTHAGASLEAVAGQSEEIKEPTEVVQT
ncbi:hypothetical protein LTR62_006202 [Meristemomyces frigidus]|uniref:DUF1751-domain-containing protein n=1 Tax=Meristemomyces frigidus TaxID=1508187 RepID=A0AAN7TDU0_9PEZI|nr:hypothetical protein LTR62_006202 [Meristemomyces frigidus]